MSTTDCEKFEPLLLDELYEELDELTSAALKRHVAGCARCKSSLDSMRSTRRLITSESLPLVDVPDGLEDRIFAAAKEAQKVVPIKGRFSRVLSAAGSWAMRPQTAMAAVFLLMIGSSAFLLRSNAKRSASEAQVSVTVAGAPQAGASAASESDRLDDKSAAAAHGPIVLPPAAATAAPAASIAANDESGSTIDRLAAAAAAGDKSKTDNTLGAIGADQPAAKGEAEKKVVAQGRAAGAPGDPMTANFGGGPTNAAAPAGVPHGGSAPGAGGGGQAAADGYSQQAQALAPAKRSGPNEAADPFTAGMAAYRARNFAEATRQLDTAAANGDQNAALWAARASKEGQGCPTALGRFENVAKNAGSTWTGHEASLEAAKCQIAMGTLDPARDRLNKLAQVPTHATPAKDALKELDAVAARRQAGHVSGGAHTTKAPSAPRAAPAPAATATQKPSDRAAGF